MARFEPLTERQAEILLTIEHYHTTYGRYPRSAALARLCGDVSPQAIYNVLSALAKKGYVKRPKRRPYYLVKGRPDPLPIMKPGTRSHF